MISSSTSNRRFPPGMVYTLLAKLYLNHAVYLDEVKPEYWEKAELACKEVIDLGQYSLESDPLAPFVTNNENSSEIFGLYLMMKITMRDLIFTCVHYTTTVIKLLRWL